MSIHKLVLVTSSKPLVTSSNLRWFARFYVVVDPILTSQRLWVKRFDARWAPLKGNLEWRLEVQDSAGRPARSRFSAAYDWGQWMISDDK